VTEVGSQKPLSRTRRVGASCCEHERGIDHGVGLIWRLDALLEIATMASWSTNMHGLFCARENAMVQLQEENTALKTKKETGT